MRIRQEAYEVFDAFLGASTAPIDAPTKLALTADVQTLLEEGIDQMDLVELARKFASLTVDPRRFASWVRDRHDPVRAWWVEQ